MGEKEEREIGLSWVLVEGDGCGLRKGKHGESAAEMESGFIGRKSVIVSESTELSTCVHRQDTLC